MSDDLPEHVRRNRKQWDEWATDYVASGERCWALPVGSEAWGVWGIPESQVGMLRPYFGLHRLEWPDDNSVNFSLGYGDWIRLLRANDFEVEDLVELRPGPDATTTFPYATNAWARQWPSEEVWKARKRG